MINKRLSKSICSFFIILVLLTTSILPSFATVTKQNNYPIVLIPGLTGWERDEMLGYKYFGGIRDIEKSMNDNGYTTYTAFPGPFSSYWDRACEVYAIIKGGTVDYGEAHSKKYGHSRYGRTYEGNYPQWGELSTENKIKKIHVVGHSMGGVTARLLVQLLEQGSDEEKAVTKEGLSPLFEGGKPWVHSVTSISSPHDGTTLMYTFLYKDLYKKMITAAAPLSGTFENPLYDLKLDQWGLKKNADESMTSYVNRVFNSSIWTQTEDFSTYDLKPEAAAELNTWVKAQPDVYYYSWATCETYTSKLTGYSVPKLGMNPLFMSFSFFLGSYKSKSTDPIKLDRSWWPNDGMCNTVAQDGPEFNSTDEIVNFNGTLQLGKWSYMGVLDGYDHMDILGTTGQNVNGWYNDLAKRLSDLPISN